MLEKVDLIGDKHIWLSFFFFNVDIYPLSLFVSTEMPQVPARFCGSENGLTNNVLITGLFHTYTDSLVK